MAAAKKAAKAFKTPVADPTDRLPSLPPVGTRTTHVRVVSVREWFDNWRLHKEGEEEIIEVPVDDHGEAVLPEHVVRAEEYEPPELDLPGTTLAKEHRGVRGGASGMPNL